MIASYGCPPPGRTRIVMSGRSMLSVFFCLIGQHQRLGRSVRPFENGYRGECRNCGVAMVRPFSGRWRRARHGEQAGT